jgi:6-pyruvoyltetrahydropterin/6-carboxytetrahydropterin synthase
MHLIRVQDTFCAAHMLRFANGSTERLHGHNWRVEVVVACPRLDADGIGIDFLEVQSALHTLLDQELDHQNLNSINDMATPNPTSERLAQWLAARLAPALARPAIGAYLQSVTVWEMPEFSVTFIPDQTQ